MPRPLSNFSRYVIPDNLAPSGICCITVPVPKDREWIAQFYGAIWRMSLQTNYERDDAHSGAVMAARWREVWEDVVTSGCCGPGINDVTINTTINVQNQQYLFQLLQIYIAAGFDIDVAFPATPDDFDSDPGDVGPEVAQRTRALCLAVESWINEVCNRGLSWIESQKEEVAALVAAGVAVPFIPVYAVIGAFVGAGILAGTVIQQLANNGYRGYLACAMFTALTGQDSNSQAAFRAALDSAPVRPPPPQNPLEDGARDLIEAWIRVQLASQDNYLGFIQLLNSAMGAADVLTDDDCGCVGGWEFVFDFTASDGGWITDPLDGSGWGAGYVPGVGWVNSGGSSQRSLAIQLTTLNQDGDFDEVKMSYILATAISRRARMQTLLVVNTDSDNVTPDGTFVTFDGDFDFATERLVALIQSSGAGQSHTLQSITFKGIGDNPFT